MRDFLLTFSGLGLFIMEVTKLLTSNQLTKYRVNIVEWSKKRALSANAQQHVWYKQISEYMHDDIKTCGNMCKLDHGLPILLDDENYGPKVSFVLDKIGFHDMTREQQINVMDLIQITSLFSTKQHNQYRDNLRMYWFNNGLELRYKDE